MTEDNLYIFNFSRVIKKFIFNVEIVIIVILILDFLIGKSLEYFYFKQKSGLQYRTTYSIDSTRAEILVFGSSRANHHYVPEVFEDSLKMSFYNTGRDGNRLLYNFAVFSSILKRDTPKIVILILILTSFTMILKSMIAFHHYYHTIENILK